MKPKALNLDMLILDKMVSIQNERLEGWAVELVEEFPPLLSMPALTYLGSFSWSVPSLKLKLIKQAHAYNIGGQKWCTPTDISRDYITAKYEGKKLRCNKKQWYSLVQHRKNQPLFSVPCVLDNACYVDLKSAYWQILQIGGWDVDYSPQRFLGVQSDNHDFPFPDNRLARNSMVSMGLPAKVNAYHPDKGLFAISAGKKNANLILWGFVQDILHGMAFDMINEASAKYVNTDGYIVHRDNLEKSFAVAKAWGLTVVVKAEGRAVIRGVGDYDIGDHRSKRKGSLSRPYSFIVGDNAYWLRPRIRELSWRVLF